MNCYSRVIIRVKLILAVTMILAVMHANATPALRAAGRISSVTPEGNVFLKRQGGGSEVARYNTLLFPDDLIVFQGDGEVQATVYNKSRTFTPSTENKIAKRESGFFSSQDEGFFERFRTMLSSPSKAYQIVVGARDPKLAPPVILRADPFAPAGTQYLTPESKSIALVWQGGKAILILKTSGGHTASFDSDDAAWAVFPFNTNDKSASISIENQKLQWAIKIEKEAPVPRWFEGKKATSETQRVVRAAWILTEGPKEWQVFAISELANLSEEGDFAATQLWKAVLSGELQKELKK